MSTLCGFVAEALLAGDQPAAGARRSSAKQLWMPPPRFQSLLKQRARTMTLSRGNAWAWSTRMNSSEPSNSGEEPVEVDGAAQLGVSRTMGGQTALCKPQPPVVDMRRQPRTVQQCSLEASNDQIGRAHV